jgi:hypothetical protein
VNVWWRSTSGPPKTYGATWGTRRPFVTSGGSGGLAGVCGGRRSFSLLEALTGSSVGLPQHADQHRPEYPIFLAVDQEFDHLVSSPLITDALRSTSILFDIDVR